MVQSGHAPHPREEQTLREQGERRFERLFDFLDEAGGNDAVANAVVGGDSDLHA